MSVRISPRDRLVGCCLFVWFFFFASSLTEQPTSPKSLAMASRAGIPNNITTIWFKKISVDWERTRNFVADEVNLKPSLSLLRINPADIRELQTPFGGGISSGRATLTTETTTMTRTKILITTSMKRVDSSGMNYDSSEQHYSQESCYHNYLISITSGISIRVTTGLS
jgi:hypothetical protein